jgi:RNA polymerase sigma-70 factor (ECF subfamily)
LDRGERALVDRCLTHDQDASTELVQRFAPMVGTIIWRVTGDHRVTEDLAQETFLRVFRGLPRFDGRAKLSTWIFTIAHRVAIDHLRRAGRWRDTVIDEVETEALDSLPARDDSPETAVQQEEFAQLVREHLAELPDKYRLPLLYVAIDGLDYDAVGALLGAPMGTVKTLVFRGKQMLKARIMAALRTGCLV